jgi:hypothetical protein
MSNLNKVAVTRNDVAVEFVPTEVKKGQAKGTEFLGPADITEQTLPQWLKWLGNEIVCGVLNSVLRQRSKGWSNEAEEESATQKDGDKIVACDWQKYMDVFIQMAQDFNLRGESIPELKEQIAELTEKFASLSYETPEEMLQAKQLAQQIKALQIAIQSKRRKTAEEAVAA